jgi:hydroxymethylpyrimidine/phosphomethylpyrimidine kinase
VLRSSSGGVLLDDAGREALMEELLPRATLVTPNIAEIASLLGASPASNEAQLTEQGSALLALGPEAVLLKGGHGSGAEAVDLLLVRGRPVRRLSSPRSARTLRGTGCALASALAAGLAAGLDLERACARAKQHVVQLFQEAS